ncbi:hypothetical protein GWO73_04450 [Corynebacterium macginleyi]|uniref:helix-turn-helix domain-containing protein n=1 Tax=Corynebacterium macginleyi TaxID=38290 RepID=UPI001909A2C9|nr:helix-turn-helix domain-containing protein [Corynebacterium macginleyi]MBK4161078.1 hypothetical protein [Corynebacterium macginleyi]
MSKETDWFASMAGRRVTVTEIAEYLGVSRRTATDHVNDGLTSDELITVSRKIGISPIHALVELGKLTYQEAFDFLDGDGQLLSTASTDQLIYQLAEDGLSPAQKLNLGSHLRKPRKPAPHLTPVSGPRASLDDDDGIVRDFAYSPDEYAADSSPNEQEEREKRGEDPID